MQKKKLKFGINLFKAPAVTLAITLAISVVAFCAIPLNTAEAANGSRIKDLTSVEGVRDNQLIGYGIVVGLPGTGDMIRNSPFTKQTIESMLERMGVNTKDETFQTKNVAAVMVTATLPPFATSGTRVDVTVSAMGDAKSLSGGSLAVTPLLGADGQVYAVAQGNLTIGGFEARGNSGSKIGRGVITNGRIANGALVEREINFDLAKMTQLRLTLRNPDFTTAQRIAQAINKDLGVGAASFENPTSVVLTKPIGYPGNMAALIARIENIQVLPDTPAKIIVDESSGVVVMGDNVKVSTVAVAQGNLTISVGENPRVSQPAPMANGQTQTTPNSTVAATEDKGDLTMVQGGVPLKQLVAGLNALGVNPRDLIQILQALKAAGALQADIEVM